MSDLDPQLVFGAGLLTGMCIAMFAFMSNLMDDDERSLSGQIHIVLIGEDDE